MATPPNAGLSANASYTFASSRSATARPSSRNVMVSGSPLQAMSSVSTPITTEFGLPIASAYSISLRACSMMPTEPSAVSR
jgi:hypothetical protein